MHVFKAYGVVEDPARWIVTILLLVLAVASLVWSVRQVLPPPRRES